MRALRLTTGKHLGMKNPSEVPPHNSIDAETLQKCTNIRTYLKRARLMRGGSIRKLATHKGDVQSIETEARFARSAGSLLTQAIIGVSVFEIFCSVDR